MTVNACICCCAACGQGEWGNKHTRLTFEQCMAKGAQLAVTEQQQALCHLETQLISGVRCTNTLNSRSKALHRAAAKPFRQRTSSGHQSSLPASGQLSRSPSRLAASACASGLCPLACSHKLCGEGKQPKQNRRRWAFYTEKHEMNPASLIYASTVNKYGMRGVIQVQTCRPRQNITVQMWVSNLWHNPCDLTSPHSGVATLIVKQKHDSMCVPCFSHGALVIRTWHDLHCAACCQTGVMTL